MDPKACYQRILNALAVADYSEAWEACEDYREWLSRGGFVHNKGWTKAYAQGRIDGLQQAARLGVERERGSRWAGPGLD